MHQYLFLRALMTVSQHCTAVTVVIPVTTKGDG
uniref:Uncharacterized protein n=1 Tax=Arundo donax TaxID=35708 RepID=A0A0A9AHN0_ARUDO